ncbi:MAG: hypothetical protein GY869_13870, partial [Planctomycetes bacterium]|nr:hypothetical protein [Planctomycetota bacterium]
MSRRSQLLHFGVFILLTFCLLGQTGCGDPQLLMQDKRIYGQKIKSFVPMNYLIGPGDELEVLYYVNPAVQEGEYKIDTQDIMRVEFYYYPTMNTTVTVRPDGRITMPLIGEAQAAGKAPKDLASELSSKYAPHLSRPNITVDMVTFNAKVEALKQAIITQDRGQSRLVVVRPDGGISLPYVGDALAAGLSSVQLSDILDKKYKEAVKGIDVTVAVLNAK